MLTRSYSIIQDYLKIFFTYGYFMEAPSLFNSVIDVLSRSKGDNESDDHIRHPHSVYVKIGKRLEMTSCPTIPGQ